MKNNVLKYKGYYAAPEYRADDGVIYGTILGIADLVDFYSESAAEIEAEFHKAVDDYLSFCQEIGKQPEKSFSGTFNVRMSPDLHRTAAIQAQISGRTLNQLICDATESYLDKDARDALVMRTAMLTATTYAYTASAANRPDLSKLSMNNESVEATSIGVPVSMKTSF